VIGHIITSATLDYTETEPPTSLTTILSDLAQYYTASGREDVEKIIITERQCRHLFGFYAQIDTIWGIPLEVHD
jgi:hypothetical protein